jgi:hydrogenase/urease accessory protein HupE
MVKASGIIWLILALICGTAHESFAHEIRPAYLRITEDSQHRLTIFWKRPAMGDVLVRLVPHLSGVDLGDRQAEEEAAPGFLIALWKDVPLDPPDLSGRTLSIEGLDRTITDVLVSIRDANGNELQRILKPDDAALTIDFAKPRGLPVPAYLELGVEHILTGIDHLMFVLGLMLLVKGRWALLRAITAFTVAHSLTLAGTALGLVRVDARIIEALVALSIVFLAVELVRSYRGRTGLAVRYPWLIAFTFGLLHGFAFAGALADVGLPANAIPLSLFLFNVGVEAGQLLFVATVLAVAWGAKYLLPPFPHWMRWVAPYGIGSFSGFWLIERLVLAVSQ